MAEFSSSEYLENEKMHHLERFAVHDRRIKASYNYGLFGAPFVAYNGLCRAYHKYMADNMPFEW